MRCQIFNSITKQVYNNLCNLKNPNERCAKIFEIAKESVGAHVKMKAFYSRFPASSDEYG